MAKENAENMAKVREAMRMHEQIQQGGKLEHAVEVDYISSEGNEYKGIVVFKRPTTMDLMKMGGLKSEFLRLGGAQNINLVDTGIRFLAHVMATLSVVLVKRPEWLKDVTKVEDTDILYHVHDLYEEWSNSFRKTVSGEPTSDSSASEGEETMDS